MIELTILTIVLSIVVFIIRPGRTPPLESPLTINRLGQFHAVLAPKLNLAQPLLEDVSAALSEQDRATGNSIPLYFSLKDEDVRAHGADHYLLAALLCDGMLYFRAGLPDNSSTDIYTASELIAPVMAELPSAATTSNVATTLLRQTIDRIANQRSVAITELRAQ